MTMPFYVAPEQMMKDRADYARKGIARDAAWPPSSTPTASCSRPRTSNTLRKISEIYDRIAFAGVGKYNEFDQLRIAESATPTSKGTASARRMSTPAAWPTPTPRSSARSSPTR